jgi:hypothetical protein
MPVLPWPRNCMHVFYRHYNSNSDYISILTVVLVGYGTTTHRIAYMGRIGHMRRRPLVLSRIQTGSRGRMYMGTTYIFRIRYSGFLQTLSLFNRYRKKIKKKKPKFLCRVAGCEQLKNKPESYFQRKDTANAHMKKCHNNSPHLAEALYEISEGNPFVPCSLD